MAIAAQLQLFSNVLFQCPGILSKKSGPNSQNKRKEASNLLFVLLNVF